MMLKDPLDLCVQEAVGKGDGQALGREKHRPQVDKHQVEEGALGPTPGLSASSALWLSSSD